MLVDKRNLDLMTEGIHQVKVDFVFMGEMLLCCISCFSNNNNNLKKNKQPYFLPIWAETEEAENAFFCQFRQNIFCGPIFGTSQKTRRKKKRIQNEHALW